jgi:PAS domain S-box-containing protein
MPCPTTDIPEVNRLEAEVRWLREQLGAATDRLTQCQQRYQSLFEHNPDAVYSLDRDGRFLAFNAAGEALAGSPLDEMVLSPYQRLIALEDIAIAEQDFARTLAGETTCSELQFARGDGTRCRTKVTSLPIIVDGEIVGAFWIVQDVTQRRESEARFRQLAENVDDAFWILDVGTKQMLYVNPAFQRMRGCPEEPMNPDPFSYLASVHELDRDRVVEAFQKAPHAVNEEYRIVQPDGAICWHWARTFPIRDGHGNLYRIGGIARDITGRKKMEGQFLRAQRMESIGTLAGGIAHDLNNVLSPIIMAVELLKMKTDDPVSHEVLTTVESSAHRGAEMVQQVLSFARGVEGERLMVHPKHLVKEIQKIVADAFPKNIEMKVSWKPELWNVLGDPTQLHQVLLNLCVNARDAMPNGGRITISTENVMLDEHFAAMHLEAKAGPHVVLQVQDSGSGMSAATLEKIFDPFFTTKELGKGTGLGLSTSLAIIKSHGGFILVNSEMGRGSTFRIHLPAQDSEVVEEEATSQSQLRRGHGELILVVDDEASIRTVTQQTLEAFGYRVVVACDGVDAVSVYAAQHGEIAAVITDMMMPIMDGPAMIQVLAKINPRGKVIAASGLKGQYDIAKSVYPTVKDFLPKPYTTEELLQTLAGVLAAA